MLQHTLTKCTAYIPIVTLSLAASLQSRVEPEDWLGDTTSLKKGTTYLPPSFSTEPRRAARQERLDLNERLSTFFSPHCRILYGDAKAQI